MAVAEAAGLEAAVAEAAAEAAEGVGLVEAETEEGDLAEAGWAAEEVVAAG